MLKILQARFQQHVKCELPDAQALFRKGRGARDGSSKKQEISQKNIYFCFIDYAKVFDCVDYTKMWKILKDGNTKPPVLPPKKSVCRSRSNS